MIDRVLNLFCIIKEKHISPCLGGNNIYSILGGVLTLEVKREERRSGSDFKEEYWNIVILEVIRGFEKIRE
ncbi:hypothetical protein IMY05_006G0174100 [Salix suchowensis]|nr:hypothetical protein IMY05_006G0174100 [Salix suchowensis]